MQTADAKKWMLLFNEKIQDKQALLSDLDTPIGDGDHGGNMSRGMQSVVDELETQDFESAGALFKMVAMQLLSKVGGASGPLYGSAFLGLSQKIDSDDLGGALEAALANIQKRGQAQLGDKTMLDVWIPVLIDLQENTLTAQKITDYVAATKDLQAKKGRASYVGERSVGHVDPGSYSSGLLFEAMLEAEVL
ncbi:MULTISPECIES: dihydroxyacetone kinase subunit DhaL [unclassified Streptococcus]|uniref:dihydroxyacetone kinase subunit DhaL n=1 Tax=unclassified Streptococcus TaxID=2608887 RepID=UPI0010725180|nr:MULTISPECIES: dihydroxyacetone kinase subunit DhaL [unclassified Streptococcus]MBF0805588.1 dihydroxyacetone kinase subunit L [Streptococcus sp. 19428wA2_WM07]TFU28955.1 dihydroxyacetone kinase subunit L [Streptococcus sp. WM07]